MGILTLCSLHVPHKLVIICTDRAVPTVAEVGLAGYGFAVLSSVWTPLVLLTAESSSQMHDAWAIFAPLYLAFGIILTTNFWATMFIAYKAWYVAPACVILAVDYQSCYCFWDASETYKRSWSSSRDYGHKGSRPPCRVRSCILFCMGECTSILWKIFYYRHIL